MRATAYFVVLTLALAGCSENNAPQDYNYIGVADNLSVADKLPVEAPKPPPHNYDFNEGLTYGYIAAVSEEDQKKGKVAGDVLMFTYHGNEDGIHKLRSVDASGEDLYRYECATPCVAIKVFRGSTVERIAYNSQSMIGSAFEDAINGHLKHAQKHRAVQTVPSSLAAYHGKYPFNAVDGVTFIKRPEVIRGVRAAVSDPWVLKWVLLDNVTAGPIEVKGDQVLMWACEPHNCGPRNWTILLKQSSGDAAVCFHDEERGTSLWYRSGAPAEQAGECPSELS